MTTTSRLGVNPKTAIKAPVVVESNANLTLSGTQTVNSVAVVAGDRVLVKDQSTSTENGIYDVSASAWTRSKDWNANDDVVSGVLISVSSSNLIWKATFSGSFNIESTVVTFADLYAAITVDVAADAAAATATSASNAAASETAAGVSATSAAASLAATQAIETSLENIIVSSFAEQVGSDLAITGTPVEVSMCSLNPSGFGLGALPLCGYFDTANGQLRAYEFDGSSPSLKGSGLAVASVGASDMCSLNAYGSRLGFVDDGNKELQLFAFDLSTWTPSGSAYALSGSLANPSIATMSNDFFTNLTTDEDIDYAVGIADDGDGTLIAYGQDSGTWDSVGSAYSFIGSFTKPSLVTLAANLMAVVDEGSNEIKILSWSGTGFTLEASHSTGLTLSEACLTSQFTWNGRHYLTLTDTSSDKIYPYSVAQLSGGGWNIAKSGHPTPLGTVGRAVCAPMDGSSLFYIDETNNDLRVLRFPQTINYGVYS